MKKRIPLREGLFVMPTEPDGKPLLIASRCPRCQAILFPKKPRCPHCQADDLETIFLKGQGKLYTYTSVLQRPSMLYKGDVPYFLGYVELPEGIRIRTLLTEASLEMLRLDLDMELVLDRLHEDEEGNEVITYKFRPIKLAR